MTRCKVAFYSELLCSLRKLKALQYISIVVSRFDFSGNGGLLSSFLNSLLRYFLCYRVNAMAQLVNYKYVKRFIKLIPDQDWTKGWEVADPTSAGQTLRVL